MEPEGLIQVADPASYFLEQREEVPPGIAAAPVYEGSRVLMVEIQALVIPAKSGYTRIYSDKIDSNRVSRVAAVLEKHLSLRFSDRDIYINVAGGMKLDEVGIELPLAVALYSARTELAVPKNTAVAGEISLAGEIRPTAHMHRRARTAAEMGFSRFLGAAPAGSSSASSSEGKTPADAAPGYTVLSIVKKSIQEVFGELRGAK
jgi:DNA repair protein RadA/Sms